MRKNSGMTLIEIAVVVGLFAMLIALGLIMSMDVWRGSSFRSEQDIVVSLLYKARSRAISNINESSHGLYIDKQNEEYIVFEGDNYVGAVDEIPFDMSNGFTFEDGPVGDTCDADSCEVVFDARTGATDGESFLMSGQGKSREVVINPEGGITW